MLGRYAAARVLRGRACISWAAAAAAVAALATSACDRECPALCYEDAEVDAAPSEASPEGAHDATLDAAPSDGSPDGARDATVDAAIEDATLDTIADASQGCPVAFRVVGRVDLVEAGVAIQFPSVPILPSAIIAGSDGAFWFITAAAQLNRQFGYVSTNSGDAGLALGFLPSTDSGVPVGIAVGTDKAEWFDLTASLGRAQGAMDLVHVVPLPSAGFTPMRGLAIDRDGLLWWAPPVETFGASLASTPENDASIVTSVLLNLLNVTSFAPSTDGFMGYAGVGGNGNQLGRVAAGIASNEAIPAIDGGGPYAVPAAMAPADDGTVWLVMDGGLQSWIVRMNADASTAFPFATPSALVGGLASVPTLCGMLVAHTGPDGLTLVALDGSMRELDPGDASLPGAAGPIAVQGRVAAVVTTQPPSIFILQLL